VQDFSLQSELNFVEDFYYQHYIRKKNPSTPNLNALTHKYTSAFFSFSFSFFLCLCVIVICFFSLSYLFSSISAICLLSLLLLFPPACLMCSPIADSFKPGPVPRMRTATKELLDGVLGRVVCCMDDWKRGVSGFGFGFGFGSV
jgi:hypothetical protein